MSSIIASALPVLVERAAAPVSSRRGAELALHQARRDGGPRWALEALQQAEQVLHLSSIEERRQQLRPLPLRDFERAREGFRQAQELARRARVEADAHMRAARASSERRILDAHLATRNATAVTDAADRGGALRAQLAHTRLLVDEAHILFARGEFHAASERADRALADARAIVADGVSRAARYVDPANLRTWRRQVEETVSWSRKRRQPAIVVDKENNLLALYEDGRLARTYDVDLGANRLGRKLHSGDEATPEGRYRIVTRKGAGQSRYYKALVLDYPNADDRQRFEQARRSGRVPKGSGPGSLIEIHGHGGRGVDWTRGCVALADRELDDLFARVPIGTPVTIVGGDGSGAFSNIVRTHTSDDTATRE